MERLVRFFVDRHLLVHVIVVGVVVLGIVQTTRSPRETFPTVTLAKLFVTGILPGASARDVETKVTIPIQDQIEQLDGVKEFSTVVSDSRSHSEIDLHDDFDADRVREAERDLKVLIDGVPDFPPEMEDEPTIQLLNSQRFPVVEVALAGPSEAVRPAGKVLERRLRKLDLVSRVSTVGLDDPEVRVYVDPDRARENDVTVLEVVSAIARRNVSATGGLLERERDRRQVVVWSRFDGPEEVARTLVRFSPGGGAVTVADVARIEVTREDNGLLAHTNGLSGVSLVVSKQENADIVDTVDAVRDLVATTPLPPGVTATLARDQSFMTRNRLQLMLTNGLVGVALVTIVLFVFLTPTAAMWTLLGLPVVFLATLALFPVFGLAINMVTLTGLVVVLGMVVDDAIVVSERIVTRRQSGEERRLAAVRGAAEMVRPVVASAITTMLAFVPLWGMAGMNGKMVQAMPLVVILALLLSVAESFTILPAHLSMGTRQAQTAKRSFVLAMERRYRSLLDRALHHRVALVVGFAAALLVVFGAIAPRMPVLLYPNDDSEAAFLKIELPPGTPIERTEAVVAAIERQLPPLMGDDLIAQTARIGHQDPEAFDRTVGAAENEAVITAFIAPTGRSHTAPEWSEIFERELIVPAEAKVVHEIQFMGPPAGAPVALHVSSNDDDVRRATSREAAEWLAGIDGVTNIDVDERPGTPQIELALDYDRLALRGLDPRAVADTVQVAFHGAKASEHRELDETTELRVLLDPAARGSLDALLELPIRSANGTTVRLRDVVNPVEVPAVSRIHHRDGVRTATVSAAFAVGAPHTALSLAARLEREFMPRYEGVPGLALSIGGEAKETRKTTGDLGLAALLAFAGIAVVIAVMLGSFLEAAFVVSVVPFAIAGVILAFFAHGQPLSMFAMLGAIGLAGVVVNASIVMIDAVHRSVQLLDASDADARREALLDAVVSRLRPIVVTTLTTLGGVLPMAYGIGGHDTVVAPMSLAIGWGLALSTGVTLFLVPALYTVAGDLRGLRLRLPRPRRAPQPDPDRSAAPAG